MSILDLAGASRTSGGPITLSTLAGYPEYVDSDDHTRCIAQRVSDGATVVVYARGAHAGIVDVHNERSRLTFERNRALAIANDDDATEDERSGAQESVGKLDIELEALPFKTRAQVTLHVARALNHYSRLDAE